jgi:hypothetical protein
MKMWRQKYVKCYKSKLSFRDDQNMFILSATSHKYGYIMAHLKILVLNQHKIKIDIEHYLYNISIVPI